MVTVQNHRLGATEQPLEQNVSNPETRILLRRIESSVAESELRLQSDEVAERIAKLEDAKNVSQELWESIISV